MKTTIELPEDLAAQAAEQARAAGLSFEEWIVHLVMSSVAARVPAHEPRRGRRSPLPVIVPARGVKLPMLTNAAIDALFEAEDLEMQSTIPQVPR